MLKAYKYRIYPTKEQETLIKKTFGSCRFVYNWALKEKEEAYKEEKRQISINTLTNRMKSELKAKYGWLTEVNSQSLQSSLRNLDDAYRNFFDNPHEVGLPKMKTRKGRQSF